MAKCLNEVIQNCSEGDEIICTDVHPLNNTYLTENKSYTVTVDGDGDLCIIDDEGDEILDASSLFDKVQPIQYSPSVPYSAAKPAQLAPREESSESNDKPRSIVDGDYSQYCTWDVEEPETKTPEWKPDTIREDIDIMESIRHACNRT